LLAVEWGIAIGLLMQLAALLFLVRRLGRTLFGHIGAVFVVVASVYHGLNEILLWLVPDRDIYRRLVSPLYVDEFVLWISAAILLLTLAYVAVVRREVQSALVVPEARAMARVFDWRLMLAAAIPLLGIVLVGNGTVSSAGYQPLNVGAGLSLQFFLLATALASFGFVARCGRRWLLLTLVLQSIAIAATGQRGAILATAGMVLYALARVGIVMGRGQLAAATVVFALMALVITSARGAEGRLSAAADQSLRFDFLIVGVANLGSATTRDQIAGDLGYRLDGNSYGAMELGALSAGMPPLGLRPLLNDVLLAVPGFLNPEKGESAIEDRSEKAYAELNLNLPLPFVVPGTRVDILPTQLGAVIGFAGPWGLLLAALLLGALFGTADRWLLRQLTPTRLLIGVAFLSCALDYEASWDVYPVTLRGVLLLLPVIWCLQRVRMRQPSKTAATLANRLSIDAAS
jgi:hypothetical protein